MPSRYLLLTTAIAVCLMSFTAHAAGQPGPVVKLFPTTVLEDIRETSAVAAEMENNLQEIIHRLDMQQKLYQESLCEGADGDQGCARMAKQLGATYLEMLNAMNERLPDMELASDASLPMRPNNFIVGIESMPVRYTPA